MTTRRSTAKLLLDWYNAHARDLPWRARPGAPAPDPYHVWLSEVMLQQTTVAAVKPYFAKFIEAWPTTEALAAASDEDVMAAWAGLGYYSRARNLVKCARQVAAMGGFPETEAGLRELPGLGAYASAAIAAIAFGQRAVVVDANVERVIARLFYVNRPMPGARKDIREYANAITPNRRAGDFAQAMMDLGATICTSRNPKCLLCPLSIDCMARENGDPSKLPIKPPKKAKPDRKGTAFWIEKDNKVWLVKREGSVMLGGMRALPDDGWTAREDGSGKSPLTGRWRGIGGVRHTFTHARLAMDVKIYAGNETPSGEGEWWPIDDLETAGLPTLFARAAQMVLAIRP